MALLRLAAWLQRWLCVVTLLLSHTFAFAASDREPDLQKHLEGHRRLVNGEVTVGQLQQILASQQYYRNSAAKTYQSALEGYRNSSDFTRDSNRARLDAEAIELKYHDSEIELTIAAIARKKGQLVDGTTQFLNKPPSKKVTDILTRNERDAAARADSVSKMIKSVKDFVRGEAEGAIVEKILGSTVGVVFSVLTDVKATASDDTVDGKMQRWRTRCDNFLAEDAGRDKLLENKQDEWTKVMSKPFGLNESDSAKVETLKSQIDSLKAQIEDDEPAVDWCRGFDRQLKIFLKPASRGADRVNVIP